MGKRFVQAGIGILILLAAVWTAGYTGLAEKAADAVSADVLVIDAGHGGIDGGAVSSRGVPEKAINLAIAKELRQQAEKAGWQVVMTREEDTSASWEEKGVPIRRKKVQDMRRRRQLIRRTKPELVVSIHLNSFREDPSVKGTQIFYPQAGGQQQLLDGSRRLAEAVRQGIRTALAEENSRKVMGKADVFLFREVISPIIIIECGFLSNPQEAELLQSGEYQKKLAAGIMTGITAYTGKKPSEPLKIVDSAGKTNSLAK